MLLHLAHPTCQLKVRFEFEFALPSLDNTPVETRRRPSEKDAYNGGRSAEMTHESKYLKLRANRPSGVEQLQVLSSTAATNSGRPGPSTRYQGSKRKLGPWLSKAFRSLRFTTAVDLMAGTGSVAYILKSMGKRVIANDYLRSNHSTLLAFIENSSIRLNDDDVNWLMCRHPNVRYSSFIEDTFQGFYFTKAENTWLDLLASNISALAGGDLSILRYKKALARHALVQACLMKRPFNLFHRKNLYIRTASVERSFGNKTTWDTPFPDLFRRLVREGNTYVFDNGHRNLAMHEDALDVRVRQVDLVYIDPPYFRSERDRALSNYRILYHFVEGLVQYEHWDELLDPSVRLKSLKSNGFSTEELYACARNQFSSLYLNWLNDLLQAWPDAQIAMSYKQPGVPGHSSIKRLIENTGRKVSVRKRQYWYALNHKNGTPKHNIELLFLGT